MRHFTYLLTGLIIIAAVLLPFVIVLAVIHFLGAHDSWYVLMPLFLIVMLYVLGRDFIDHKEGKGRW